MQSMATVLPANGLAHWPIAYKCSGSLVFIGGYGSRLLKPLFQRVANKLRSIIVSFKILNSNEVVVSENITKTNKFDRIKIRMSAFFFGLLFMWKRIKNNELKWGYCRIALYGEEECGDTNWIGYIKWERSAFRHPLQPTNWTKKE